MRTERDMRTGGQFAQLFLFNTRTLMPMSSLIESTETCRRWLASLITTGALFVLLCSIWPFSVSGFRSSAALSIDQSVEKSDEQLKQELSDAVLAETSDEQLQTAIDAIEESGNLRSERIEYRDFQTIRESLRIGLFDDKSNRRYQIAYEGDGGLDERQLVDILTYRVASRLNQTHGQRSGNLEESFEQLEWIVDQIEGDLVFVKRSLTQMENPSGEFTLEESGDHDSSNFHLASSKRNATPTLDDIEGSIDAIDVENLRSVILSLKTNVTSDRDKLNSNAGSELREMKASKTLPINGVPSLPFLLLLGSLSAMVGSVVAWHFDPFAKRGFLDPHSVSDRLNVPVIGTLNLTSPHNTTQQFESAESQSEDTKQERFANRCVGIARLFLVCFFVVVFTFILFNSEVREAFFENPFFGGAKIVRVLTGY